MKACTPYEGKHCCTAMDRYLQDYRIPIDFDPEMHFYFLPFVWPYRTMQGLRFCPWCGIKLPEVIELEELD